MTLEQNLIHRTNVGDILTRSARKFPNKTAVVEGDRRVTYKALNSKVNQLARGFLAMGLQTGDTMALLLSNSIEFLMVYFACAKAGITVVPINLSLLPHEVDYIIRDSGSKAVVLETVFLERVPETSAGSPLRDVIAVDYANVTATSSGYNFHDLAALFAQDDSEVECIVDDRATMQCLYTSGTTSNPKGVISSHLAVYLETLGTAFDLKFTEAEVSIAMMPLFHTAQLNAFTTPVFIAGGTTVLMKKFEPLELMTLIEREGATQIFGLPMMFRALLDHPRRTEFDLSTLRLCVYAMAPMPDHELRRCLDTFGCDFALLFGQTEMAPVATVFRPEHQLTKSGSVGNGGVNVEVAVMDEDGRLLPEGEIGEVVYRSPQTMEGYLNDPEKTAEAFEYGWFHSGDIGYLDSDSILWFVDRKKDMVKTGGENVASIEVEKLIFKDPRIQNVAVVGLPHEHWSEALTAFVVVKPGQTVSEQELLDHCKSTLANYKVPKRVVFVEQLPMTSTGKIQKHVLRAEYEKLYV